MRRRLVVLSLAMTAMIVTAFTVPLALLVRELAADRATTPAQLRAQALAPVVGLADEATIRAALEATRANAKGTVHVLLPDGRVLGDSVDFPDVARDQAGVYELADGSRIAVVPVVAPDGKAAVAVTIPAEALRSGVLAAWSILGVLALALAAGGALLTDRLARGTTRALEDVEAAARSLSEGDLAVRVAVQVPDEVHRIGLALNELAERTQELLVAERERGADLSHALRTPLTALRLDAESLPASEARDAVIQDVEAMQHAIDQAIEEARRPSRGDVVAPTDLAEVVRARLAWWEPLANDEDRGLGVDVVSGPCWVRCRAADLGDLVDAIVGNVFAHTPPGTGLQVELGERQGVWVLAVTDEGPGFPSDVDVFERGTSAGGSTGLGLAIVDRIARSAGGEATVEPGGNRLEVRFPAAASPR